MNLRKIAFPSRRDPWRPNTRDHGSRGILIHPTPLEAASFAMMGKRDGMDVEVMVTVHMSGPDARLLDPVELGAHLGPDLLRNAFSGFPVSEARPRRAFIKESVTVENVRDIARREDGISVGKGHVESHREAGILCGKVNRLFECLPSCHDARCGKDALPEAGDNRVVDRRGTAEIIGDNHQMSVAP